MVNSENVVFKSIGVYGTTEDSFFETLIKEKIDTFCDMRQRRLVRGSKYSYVNSTKLQEKLKSLGISYIHIKELAPTNEIRALQKQADLKSNTLKNSRRSLSPEFILKYKTCCLSNFTLDKLKASLPIQSKVICFFCVEKEPEACHRSVVTNFLKENYQCEVRHIL